MAIQSIGHFIGGSAVAGAAGGRTAPVYNPATGEQTGAVALASADEVRSVIANAAEAQAAWGATPPLRRAPGDVPLQGSHRAKP